MSGRVRILIIVAVLVILIGVGAAFLLPQLNRQTTPTATPGAGTTTAPRVATNSPGSTPLPLVTDVPTLDIVVAVQPIGRGTVITAAMVDYRKYPEAIVPTNAIFDLEFAIGKIARTDIFREELLLSTKLTDNLSELGAVGSDAAAVLPPNTRLVSIPIDMLTTGAYAIQPGDHVDAIISMLFVDLDEEMQTILPNTLQILAPEDEKTTASGRIITTYRVLAEVRARTDQIPFLGTFVDAYLVPSENPRPRLTTQMTIQDALVVNVGEFPSDGRLFSKNQPTPVAAPVETQPTPTPATNQRSNATAAPTQPPARPQVISLAVSPQDAVVVVYYVESRIPVTFVLRPAGEITTVTTQPVTLEYIMGRYQIQVPRKLTYGIEPAIRSIRQLINTPTVELSSSSTGTVQQSSDTGQ